ncbi:MAG: NAD(+)/NADH kinase, partial [Methanoculleus sp.]
MRITLVSRLDDAEALRYTASLGRELKDLGHDVALEEGTARRLRRNGGTPFEEIDADLVVVVGGDGSVLLTVQRMRKQVPILGINWGEVGFLTDLEPGEAIDFFAGLDAFEVEQRMRVRLSAGGRVLGDALNEGLIVTDRPAK